METLEPTIIPTIVNSGAVGIAIVLAWILYKVVTNHFTHTNDIISKNTDAWVKQAETMGKFCEKIDSIKK
jgi:hypothetical protein